MDQTELFFRFAVSLVIGGLIGLQREFSYDHPERELAAGVRTFALICLLGCAGALLSDLAGSPWIFGILLLILGVLFSVSHLIESFQRAYGLTTEVSAVLTLLVGAIAYWGDYKLAIALGVAITVLLSAKAEMSRFVLNLTRSDVYATLKFAVISAIVLPILPNHPFGPPPFAIFNPFQIWLLVVFISGMNFVGYILIKVLGAQKGIGLTGLLGGLASSTALTLSFTQRSRDNPALAGPFAFGIIVAWTVMFFRVVAEVMVVNRALIGVIWEPVLAAVCAGLGYCLILFLRQRRGGGMGEVDFANPFELGPAVKFGLIFTAVLLISKAAHLYMGKTGIYLSALISGLADADAVVLSLAQLSREGTDPVVAGQGIVLAAVSNTFAKGGIVLLTGGQALRRAIVVPFLLMTGAGLLVAFLQ